MDSVDWKEWLTKHPVFTSLSQREIEEVLRVSHHRRYVAGETIVSEGEQGDSVFLIGAGTVEVNLRWGGEQSISLATLQPGEFFGEMAALQKISRRSATVVANSNCELLEIQGREFLQLAAQHHEIEATVIGKLTSHLRDVNEQVIKVKVKTLDERIELLNTRLESQQQATDATLHAAHTVFEQTTRRANEIIESADRTRHRFIQTASVFGTLLGIVITVLGVMGWNELNNFRDIGEAMRTKHSEMVKAHEEMQTMTESLDETRGAIRNVEDFARATQEYSEATQEISQAIANLQATVRETSAGIARNILLHEYRDAVQAGSVHVATKLFRSSRNLSPEDPPLALYLAEVESHMGDGQQYDYAPLLKSMLVVARGSDRIQANYLLLVNSIINRRDGISANDPASTYKRRYEELEKSIPDAKQQFHFENALVSAISKEPADRERACNLLKLVPPRDESQLRCD